MIWADAKTYAWLWTVSRTDQYRNQLLYWLEWENPDLHKRVVKEISMVKGKA